MKAVPCEDMEQTYCGGFADKSFQMRTVESLDAERTNFGFGKLTPRTYPRVTSISDAPTSPMSYVGLGLTSSSCPCNEADSL